jgi:hypothetical protein
MTVTLYRPVGLHELALIWDSDCHAFPPRLSHQPIFYPVANAEYAHQIARDWNTPDEASGYCGFVTRFAVETAYLSQFETRTVGSSVHVEYWIPAESLNEFNHSISGGIHVDAAHFGKQFTGHIPNDGILRALNASLQFVKLSQIYAGGGDLREEVSANKKAVFLNYLFWKQADFSAQQISAEQQSALLAALRASWHSCESVCPLPGTKT